MPDTQLHLFGEENQEPLEDKYLESSFREEVDLYAETPVPINFPALSFPYRWERLKVAASKKRIPLKPLISPVYEGIETVDEEFQRIAETGMGRLLVISGSSGSGKTTFLNSLEYFIGDLDIHNIKLGRIDSSETVHLVLDSIERDIEKLSLVILEGKETPGSLKDEEIDNLLAALNADFRADTGCKTLFVIPTTSQAVASSISQRAIEVGKMTSPNKPFYVFEGPKKDKYIQITNETLRALNDQRTLLEYGIDENYAKGIAEASKSVGDFMESCYEEIQRERNTKKKFILSSRRKRIHLWMVFCTSEITSRNNNDIIRSLSFSNNQHVQIDRMLSGSSKEIKFWEDKQGQFARAVEYLDLRIMYLPMRTANAAFIAYGSKDLIQSLEKQKLIDRQAATRERAQRSLSGTAVWAFYNNIGFVDRDVTKRGSLTDQDRDRFQAVIKYYAGNDKALNRIIASIFRDLIKDPAVKVTTEQPLNSSKSLLSDIAIVTQTDIYCIELKWRSGKLQDGDIIAQTIKRVRDFSVELQELANLLEI